MLKTKQVCSAVSVFKNKFPRIFAAHFYCKPVKARNCCGIQTEPSPESFQ